MATGRRGNDDDVEKSDEDALVTMVDQPGFGFLLDEEDDSDLASTQLEWVSPLDPRFGDGKPIEPPERFPADEPLEPPRRLSPDFAAPRSLPEETDPTLNAVSEAEKTNLRPVLPSESTDPLASQDLDLSDLELDAPTEPPPTHRARQNSGGRNVARNPSTSLPSGERVSGLPPQPRSPSTSGSGHRPAVPSLERRMKFDRPPRKERPRTTSQPISSSERPSESARAFRLILIGLVVTMLAALFLLALAATLIAAG